jgi:hypothetical protein
MTASDAPLYEVHVRRSGTWHFDMGTADQEDAIAEAQRLADKGVSTKVTREVFCEQEGVFHSQTIYKSDRPKMLAVPAPAPKRAPQLARVAPCPQPAAKKGFLERLFG